MKKPQLFLLHFAGGNCYSFQFLTPMLNDFEIINLELPGRGKRMQEPLLKDFDEAARDLYARVLQKLRSSLFFIYGHSMGAYLALRIARLLEENGTPPCCLVVSGNAGPGVSYGKEDKKRYLMDRKELKEELAILGGVPGEVLENEELFSFLEPILKADFQIAEDNGMDNEPPVNIPLHAIMGTEEGDAARIGEWGRFTKSGLTYELLEGNHFFIFTHAARLAAILRNCYSVAVPERATDKQRHLPGLLTDLTIFSEKVNLIYNEVIRDYHLYDSIEKNLNDPYPQYSIEWMLYSKCWTDTVQWHVEDEIRNPDIEPLKALKFKRRIDNLNQDRTEKVEHIDDYFLRKYAEVAAVPGAKINSESPAWALDRLSILALKVYHMQLEVLRKDVAGEHVWKCQNKLDVLIAQQKDLFLSINELVQDISKGYKYMKVYKQMKMYNDPELNPVLYNSIKI